MAKTVICRILPKSGAGVVTLQIHPAIGGSRRLIISKTQDFKFSYGDRIECITGTAAVMINPGTAAGTFLLQHQSPNAGGNCRREIEINDETTKVISRGKVSVANDIGTVLAGGTASTR